VYYTLIKHDGHLRTRGKCRKRLPQASLFYISRVFSNVRSVLSQCNIYTRLRLLHLFYDIALTRAKQLAAIIRLKKFSSLDVAKLKIGLLVCLFPFLLFFIARLWVGFVFSFRT